jgi:hypothetical protein
MVPAGDVVGGGGVDLDLGILDESLMPALRAGTVGELETDQMALVAVRITNRPKEPQDIRPRFRTAPKATPGHLSTPLLNVGNGF